MRTPTTKRRATRGLLATEVLLAILVLGLTLAPFLSMLSASTRHAARSSSHAAAWARAAGALDALASRDWQDLEVGEPEDVVDVSSLLGDASQDSGFRVSARFQRLEPGLGILIVDVEWDADAGPDTQLQRSTRRRLVTRPDLAYALQLD